MSEPFAGDWLWGGWLGAGRVAEDGREMRQTVRRQLGIPSATIRIDP
jgi:hypothetical protein